MDIGKEVKKTEDEAQQLELAKKLYNLFIPYSTMMNKWMVQRNEIRVNLESLLGIKNHRKMVTISELYSKPIYYAEK